MVSIRLITHHNKYADLCHTLVPTVLKLNKCHVPLNSSTTKDIITIDIVIYFYWENQTIILIWLVDCTAREKLKKQ